MIAADVVLARGTTENLIGLLSAGMFRRFEQEIRMMLATNMTIPFGVRWRGWWCCCQMPRLE